MGDDPKTLRREIQALRRDTDEAEMMLDEARKLLARAVVCATGELKAEIQTWLSTSGANVDIAVLGSAQLREKATDG